MKTLKCISLLALGTISMCANAQTDSVAAKKETKAVIKPYGFVRNYFTFDTRESKSGTDELYYYLPLDESIQADGTDVNAHPTSKWSAITSRIGLDVKGYEFGKMKVGAKIEADFYSGLSGVTGTAQFRLRQAFSTLNWGENGASHSLKIGQAWHPMAADMVHSTDLEIGVPFGPFSRTPQITYDYKKTDGVIGFTASALWQMQYTSGGPEGGSANYIKYSNVPELYAGVNFTKDKFLGRIGVDFLSIKPRYKGEAQMKEGDNTVNYTALVSDRISTVSPFVYLQYKADKFEIRAKSILAQAGEHMNMNGGYGVTKKFEGLDEDGHWEYTPTRYSSSWVSMSFGKKTSRLKGLLFAGYAKNLGTADELLADYTDDTNGKKYANIANNYLAKNTYANVNSMWQVSPSVVCTWGKIDLSFEWQITSVEYGSFLKQKDAEGKTMNFVSAENGLAEDNLHWITNNRLQVMLKYTF